MAQAGIAMTDLVKAAAEHHAAMLNSLDQRAIMLNELDAQLDREARRNGHQGELTGEHAQVRMEQCFVDALIVRCEQFHSELKAGIESLQEAINE